MPRSRTIQLIAQVFLISLLAGLIGLRAILVDQSIGLYTDCLGCYHSSVLYGDLVIIWGVTAALLLAGLIKPVLPGRLLQLLIGLLLIVYISDLLVYKLFSSRLFLADVALFYGENAAIWNQFSSGVGGTLPAASILLGALALLVFLVWMPAARAKAPRFLLLAILVMSLLASVTIQSPAYVNDWATKSVFSANLETTEREPYSAGFEAKFAKLDVAASQEIQSPLSPQAGRNVIVVMLESWSSWHSKIFGGEHDWTPQLDATARRGLRFSNFHGIGFSTDKGLVGILAGQKTWSPFLHWFETPPFHSMWGIKETLPRVFTRAGYEAAFLTSGPLSLYQKGEWLTDLGFTHVEGNEHPFYKNEARYAFDAASDEALYQRATQLMNSIAEPYLLVLETVSTHQPYIVPGTGERSLEKAMRYADRAFGDFLEDIENSGFLENGLLVVLSDHRSMTPVPASELERFGPDALSLVPAFVIGKFQQPGSLDERVLSQSDLVPSFDGWLNGHTRIGRNDAIILDAGQQTDKCAFHARGDRRGLLEVICQQGRGQVRLDGDNTRFVQAIDLDEKQQQALLNTVAAERLAGLKRHRLRQEQAVEPAN